MAQQHIARQFHMPVVLRQFFVTLEQEVPLRPGLHLGLAYSLGEGGRLIAMHVFEIFWNLLLQFTHRLADLRHSPLRTKFCVAVALHLTSS
jgi:hypothetical protein